jgi:site-specific recombinase XerD
MSPEQKLFLDRQSLRNLAPRTVENYRHALIKLSQFHNNSSLIMTGPEIEEFLLHELRVEKLEPATVNLHAAVFKTFFNPVAPDSTVMKDIVKVKEIRKLPTVKAAALPERPLVAVKAISIFYSSEAVVL